MDAVINYAVWIWNYLRDNSCNLCCGTLDIKEEENVMKYTTVIFDLDGTLLDTIEDLTDSVNFTCRNFGYEEYDIETIKSFVGNGIRKLLERAVPGGVSNPHYEDIYKTFCGHYEKNCHNKTRPYKGILELLSVLKRKGCNIAIVSNKNENAVLELNREFFGDYITVAVGQNDTTRKKPAPDTVLKAMEELHAQKAEPLYIGDSEVDKMTADNAGIDCVLVSWGFRKREVLEKMKPLFLADTPGQIESLF